MAVGAPATTPGTSGRGAGLRASRRPLVDLRHSSEYGVAILLVSLGVVATLTSPTFRTYDNLVLILEQSSTLLIVALPFGLLLMCRYIDLSVGSAIAVIGVLTATLVATSGKGLGWNPWAVSAGMLVLSALYGAVQGWVVTRFSLNPFVLSLGLLATLRGLAFILQGDRYAEGLPLSFLYLGQGRFRVVDVPISVVLALGLAVVFYLYAHHSRHGRHTQAIAGNARAAFLSGIPVRRHVVTLYVMLGLGVCLAALIQTSKLDSGTASVGSGFELSVLTAVLLGGVAFEGGRGTVAGVVLGCVYTTSFTNVLQQWGVGANATYLANGVVLALAAGLPSFSAWIVRIRQERAAREDPA